MRDENIQAPSAVAPASLSVRDRILLAGRSTGLSDRRAMAALRKALRLLGLASAEHLVEMRSGHDPLRDARGLIEEQTSLLGLLQEAIGILGERWDKIPDRKRPHYTPPQRFAILRLKLLLALSQQETARTFRVSPTTVANWECEMIAHPERATVGTTVRPSPPVRRYADIVPQVVQAMKVLGQKGDRTIAAILARAGWKISKDSVRRYRSQSAPVGPTLADTRHAAARAVRPKYVHHIWFTDITRVEALFGRLSFHIATVFDGFSRMPLATRVYDREPSAQEITALRDRAISLHGRPRHLVSDQGSQFTAQAFKDTLQALRVHQRFGAIGQSGSIALLERFFRSLKELLAVPWERPLLKADLEHRLQYALVYYAHHRPHQGLRGATPAEVYFDLVPACRAAVHPPRRPPGEHVGPPPFTLDSLDPEGRFPILKRAA